MKRLILFFMLGFGATLAFVIGQRLTTDAMAVVLGVAVGVAASVPTTVLLMALLRRAQREANWRTESYPPPAPPYGQPQQPNVIVIPAGMLADHTARSPYIPPPQLEIQADGGLRRLRVVGDDED
ncbi:MAG: hypothetical protein N2439_09635 [Anaerolineae bacterium]|nr:hypothetical protein [Anaerolineae bacterium]